MDIKNWLSQQSHAATSVFHMGRYCGKWKATTHATGNPSFHVILEGHCWLTLESKNERVLLDEGDIVFFFSNRPFYLLSSSSASPDELPVQIMSPISHSQVNDTALLCGFLKPTDYKGQLLFTLMPEYLVIRRGERGNKRLHKLFELLKLECWQAESECDLTITRLTDILLVYIMEEIIDEDLVDINLLQASQDKRMSELIMAIMHAPSETWSTNKMSEFMYMSRSTFIRKVREVCNYSPNELVIRLRVNIATNLFRRGCSVSDASLQVGYGSLSSFFNVFRKITTETPAAFVKKIKDNSTPTT